MIDTNTKVQKLINSYVPEFAYEPGAKDPGSVLTDLCAGMLADSQKRFDMVIPRSRIQYLNLFESMVKEPASASRGYVMINPVTGVEDMIPVPKGTQFIAQDGDTSIVFETEHDVTVTDVQPERVVFTDGRLDKLVTGKIDSNKFSSFYAFDVRGVNTSEHKLYLGFDELLDYLDGLDLYVFPKASAETDQNLLIDILSSDDVKWSILEEEGAEREFDVVEKSDGAIHLMLDGYTPKKVIYGQREAAYIVLTAGSNVPKIYVDLIKIGFSRSEITPDEMYLNGVLQTASGFLPFGKPLGLYNEFSFDDKEALSRKGAKMSLSFMLSYRHHEEILEVPEVDQEFKAIMKKPHKPAAIPTTDVHADYVLWEYRSVTGWKRLFAEDSVGNLCNGSHEGKIELDFICPPDIADYDAEENGRIRARLISAENIYKIPALYHCPFFADLKLRYTYMDDTVPASYAVSYNNYDIKDVTKELAGLGSVVPFYQTEENDRCMYLGFPGKISGTPFSLYFDIENYSDRPVDFRIEYCNADGFRPVKFKDFTEGFTGSGNILMIIPTDAVKSERYGYEGYFLRFRCLDKKLPDYALPLVSGIYPNMARVVNRSTVTEEFYLDDINEQVNIQLNQYNLLRTEVYVYENGEWIQWEEASSIYDGGRTYTLDRERGIVSFRKNIFALYQVSEEGPQVKVLHCNYTGSKANLPADTITTIGTAIRFVGSVTNPFPTYGGYDSFTESTQLKYVTGLMRSRNRAVTDEDFYHIITQTAQGIRKVKCVNHVDASGNSRPEAVTVAVLIEEYEKGAHVFSEIKRQIRERLLEDSVLLTLGRELNLVEPHFVKVNVRAWLEKENLDEAYDIQYRATELISDFIDPLKGGQNGTGWEIGYFPRTSQIIAALRTGLPGVNVTKLLMTAMVDGKEVTVTDEFVTKMKNPILMAVNGEHIVYIEVL